MEQETRLVFVYTADEIGLEVNEYEFQVLQGATGFQVLDLFDGAFTRGQYSEEEGDEPLDLYQRVYKETPEGTFILRGLIGRGHEGAVFFNENRKLAEAEADRWVETW